MRISALRIKNFRALKETPQITLSLTPVIIGRNDTGKSSVLYALAVFFGKRSLDLSDFYIESGEGDSVEIEVGFTDLDDNVKSLLQHKRLLSSDGHLIIKKSYGKDLKEKIEIKAYDYENPNFQNLWSKKEGELNDLCKRYGISVIRSGRSITNESKIDELTHYAEDNKFPKKDDWIIPDNDTRKEILDYLPEFTLFPSEMNLATDKADFQGPFQEMIYGTIDLDQELKCGLEQRVNQAISEAMRAIEENLREQTDTVTHLIAKPEFQWKKLVSLDIETEDQFKAKVPLTNRGLGVRRLLMVAFLKYMAERTATEVQKTRIYAIEEPETFLHPKAQRDLIEAFHKLKARGNQIIITSHSPVFAAEAEQEDIVLISRKSKQASVAQGEQVTAYSIAAELGILPRDSVAGYSACVFVEGPADKVFFETISRTLYAARKIGSNLLKRKIGFVPVGGNNLKFFVEKELILKRLNRRFAVIVDSDKKQRSDSIPKKLLKWQSKCQQEGGQFYILRKRQVENYLNPKAIAKVLNRTVNVEEFNDVKEQIPDYDVDKHLKPVVEAMSAEEILEMDKYLDDAKEKHEFLDIFERLQKLTESDETQ